MKLIQLTGLIILCLSVKSLEVPLSDPVCLSSRRVAASRAIEFSRGSNAIVSDPFASTFAGIELMNWAQEVITKYGDKAFSARKIPIRTRYYDDFCYEYANLGTSQFVSLGAGMDTRPFRTRFPSNKIRYYEIDHFSVINYKDEIIKLNDLTSYLTCARYAIPGDLSDGSWSKSLQDLDFSSNIPTSWLLEGLLMYLPEQTVFDVFNKIDQLSFAGSSICASYVNNAVIKNSQKSQSKIAQSWIWGCDDIEEFFKRRYPSWKIRAAAQQGYAGVYPHGSSYGIPSLISENDYGGEAYFAVIEKSSE